MLIVHVMFRVAAIERDNALSTLVAEAGSVRDLPGCTAFIPFADPTDPQGVGLLEEWESDAAFAAYTASAGFAATGRALRPLMLAAPVSRRFDAVLAEVVN